MLAVFVYWKYSWRRTSDSRVLSSGGIQPFLAAFASTQLSSFMSAALNCSLVPAFCGGGPKTGALWGDGGGAHGTGQRHAQSTPAAATVAQERACALCANGVGGWWWW